MKSRDCLAKAKKCEKRAAKMHRPEDREWQLILARAYRILAESEVEAAAQRKRQEGSRASIIGRIAYGGAGSRRAEPRLRAGYPAGALSGRAHQAA